MPAIHSFLVGLVARLTRLLPQRMHGALDAWSRRIAQRRALRRQQTIRPKG